MRKCMPNQQDETKGY